jgi:oxygen-independent coproporphyrinogen III oxidase
MPFCRSRCSYCHFLSLPYERALARRYEHAVLREIEICPEAKADSGDVDSIYFGGGTPSILGAKPILAILQACRRKFQVQDDCEISLEANPGTISKTKISAYRKGGIRRISMGVQTFSDQELSAIGRAHSSVMVFDSLRRLREGGFESINLDLMLGLPYQTRGSWKHNLETVADFGIPHISVYMLDLDDPCPLQTKVEEGLVLLPEDDLVSDLYLETIEFLALCGYQQYEISNFARPGYACRHNLKYWKREPVYGFGLGSHSFDGNTRWANTSQMDDYLTAVEAGQNPRAWQESMDTEHALQETLFLGLRLAEGVDWKGLQSYYGAERLSTYEGALEDWLQQGLVQKIGDVVRLTASGMLLSNEVFQQFV